MRLLPDVSRSERGAVMIIFAAAMVALLGIAALVVDVANFHQLRRQAQATVDASVLAGALDIDDYGNASAFVIDYAGRNMGIPSGAWVGCTDPGKDLGIFTADEAYDCISISEDGTVLRVNLPTQTATTFFASILGFDSWAINVSANADVYFESEDGGGEWVDPFDPETGPTYDIREGYPGDGYERCENFDMVEWDYEEGAKKKGKGKTKWTEAIFVFEHSNGNFTVLCGSSGPSGGGNTFTFDGIGGTNPNVGGTNTNSMDMHVSCSESWQHSTDAGSGVHPYPDEDGWANLGKGDPEMPDPFGHWLESAVPKNVDVLDGSDHSAYYSEEGRADWISGGDSQWKVLRAIMVKMTLDDNGLPVVDKGGPQDRNVCPGKDPDHFTPAEGQTPPVPEFAIRLSN